MEESFMGTCCFFPCQAGRLDVFFAGNIAASTRKEPMSDAVRDPSKKRNFPNGWPQESSVAVPQFNYCSSVRRWSAFKSTSLYLSQSNITIRIQSYDKISWGFLHLQESVRPGALCWSTTRCSLLWLQGTQRRLSWVGKSWNAWKPLQKFYDYPPWTWRSPWKLVVGRPLSFLGPCLFSGQAIGFREGIQVQRCNNGATDMSPVVWGQWLRWKHARKSQRIQ